MSKKAILYIRVSTDEQADKGYSLQHQKERLEKYCEINKIIIAGVFAEDHSAKTFERPEFNKLLAFIKKNKGDIDFLFFINWSRFSRNAGDAYFMINKLTKLGVDPQAVDQPLDLSVPENKMMLAFYLAAPEVENDRRSLNVIAGMRRAKKEGRWVGTAPLGYTNQRDEVGKAIIVPNELAPVIANAFQDLATGLYSIKEVYQKFKRQGLRGGLNNFYFLVRNPVYTGMILIPALKDEKQTIVKGIHQPLVPIEIYNEVQLVLNGKRRKYPVQVTTIQEELFLRGFLICPRCGKPLTGSASKGNGGRYFYYHCSLGCKERIKATDANKELMDYIHEISMKHEAMDLFHEIFLLGINNSTKEANSQVKELREEIEKNHERLEKAELLMLDGQLEPRQYKEIKDKYDTINMNLKRQEVLSEVNYSEVVNRFESAIDVLKRLDSIYQDADVAIKRKIIGAIFPGKLFYKNGNYRTNELNELVASIFQVDSELAENKKRLTSKKTDQPNRVGPVGIEPTTT